MIKRLEDFTDYAEATEKLTRLKQMLDEVEKSKAQALSTLSDARKSTPTREAARQFLETDLTEATVDQDAAARSREYSGLVKRSSMLIEAIKLQQREVGDIQAARSKEVIKAIRPAYTKRVREILSAARNLSRQLADEKAYRDELIQAGIQHIGNLPTLAALGVGDLSDPNSRINHFIKALADDGYIDAAEREVLSCVK
ncbi:MAG: hypothetical protein EG822_18060 [Deltaproteobacteria bacterium]|nr:hypothetical protein [Deltaproteobacteria bacterium]TLN00912.1 MAG: hypothetical protein FDZ73_17800 [bacterium]